MGILDFFRSKSADTNQQTASLDRRKAECPYCGQSLSKIPGSKTKCPHCGEFMYVRTQPKDNARVVVTKEQADKIEEEWSIVAGTHDTYLAQKETFAEEKELLKTKFGGKEPSDNDVRWGLLNKQLLEHARKGDWGLYRNDRFEMAEILRQEMKLREALRTYLEVCYLDLNGPNNRGGMTDPELLRRFPPFTPDESAFLAPGVVDRIRQVIRKLKLTEKEIKDLFFEQNSHIENSLRLPLTPEACWQGIETSIRGDLGR
jgi:predicted RNA-binding Zn-ribbon protein involved in translation (DUF1610 family)